MAIKNEDLIPACKRFAKTLVCLAVAGSINAAYAQQAEEDQQVLSSAEDEVEVIQVKGIRASMAQNLAEKRMAGAVVDAITAEDIGKFPDKNVADSLQRVPGVVITRSGGEGSNVSIRGLSSDLTLTQLNGNYIASSPDNPSRSFEYNLLPSAMVERLEVFKSPEARLDAGGVGGTVILHSRKPLAMDAGSGVLNIEATYADVTDDYEPNGTALYSWKNDDETFGILAGFTQQTRTNRSMSAGARNWRYFDADGFDSNGDVATDFNGDPVTITRNSSTGAFTGANGVQYESVWAPNLVDMGVTDEERTRTGFQLTTQWRPTDDLELTFNYFNFKLEQESTVNSITYPEWARSQTVIDAAVAMPEEGRGAGVIVGMDYVADPFGDNRQHDFPAPWIFGQYVNEESTSDTVDLKAVYEGDDVTITGIIGHTESEGGPSETWTVAYYSMHADRPSYPTSEETEYASAYGGWAFTDNTVDFYMDPSTIDNMRAGIGGTPDAGQVENNDVINNSTLEENYAQIDFEYYAEFGIIQSIKTGLKYRSAKVERDQYNYVVVDSDIDVDAAIAADELSRNDSFARAGGIPEASGVIAPDSLDNISGGISTNLFPYVDMGRYRSQVLSEYQPAVIPVDSAIFELEEKILAYYIQGEFEFWDDFSGNVGVRVEKSETDINGVDEIRFNFDYLADDGVTELAEGPGWAEVKLPVQRTIDQTDVLPSLNIKWDATDDWVVRLAVAKTLARPNYMAMGRNENLRYTSQEYATERGFGAVPGWSGQGGNKNLEPFKSFQSDISVEWYYQEGSALGFAIFNKDVSDFVVPLFIDVNRPFDGYSDEYNSFPAGDIQVTPFETSANAGDATSRGFEFFMQHAFESGFGFNANYTYNDASEADLIDSDSGEKVGTSPLPGSADYQANFSLYYENDDFSVRASYNKRGEMVMGLNPDAGMFYYVDPYDQIDLNASYSIMEDLTFTWSVINLTKSEEITRIGNDTDRRIFSNDYSGRRYYAGLTYSF